jgi:hypothetical protein
MTTTPNQTESSLPDNLRSFGRYETVRLIGEGAMGRVYLARDPMLLRDIALKVIAFDQVDDPEKNVQYLDRFTSEARASARLNHPTIVGVYDVGHQDGTPWIAFQYVEGESLAHLLKRAGRLDKAQSIRIALDVASALEHAHGFSILHRDIKPGNILIDAKTGTAKLTDFGIAKAPWSPKTQDGMFIGSPGYASPEQIDGGELDARSDIFSLGVLLYFLLSGKHPFYRDTLMKTTYAIIKGDFTPIRHLVPDIGPELEMVVTKCMAIRPKDRFASAANLIKALQSAQTEQVQRGGFRKKYIAAASHLARAVHAGATATVHAIRQLLRKIPWAALAAGSARVSSSAILQATRAIGDTLARLKPGVVVPWRFPQIDRRRVMRFGAAACGLLLVGMGILLLVKQKTHSAGMPPRHLIVHSNPQYPEFDQRVTRCRMLLLADSLAAASAIAGELCDKAPQSPYGHIFLGWIAFKRDDYNAAQTHLDAIKRLKQHTRALRDELAFMLDDIRETLVGSRAEQTLIDLLAHTLELGHNHTFRKWAADTRYWLRWNTVKVLNAADVDVDMVPVYILDLQHAGSFQTRMTATEKLGELKDKRAVPVLKEVAENVFVDPFVALKARATLRECFGVEVE